MKLCIFAGTFNPIHNAHLKMAQCAYEQFGFDKIIFIPAFNPPHKNTALSEHRYKMVEMAVKNYPHFDSWYEAEKLKNLIEFVLFERAPEDISSTEIRQRIKENKSISNMVPKEVGEYIERHNLYK